MVVAAATSSRADEAEALLGRAAEVEELKSGTGEEEARGVQNIFITVSRK